MLECPVGRPYVITMQANTIINLIIEHAQHFVQCEIKATEYPVQLQLDLLNTDSPSESDWINAALVVFGDEKFKHFFGIGVFSIANMLIREREQTLGADEIATNTNYQQNLDMARHMAMNQPMGPQTHDTDHVMQLLITEIKDLINAHPGISNDRIVRMILMRGVDLCHWIELFPSCCDLARQEIAAARSEWIAEFRRLYTLFVTEEIRHACCGGNETLDEILDRVDKLHGASVQPSLINVNLPDFFKKVNDVESMGSNIAYSKTMELVGEEFIKTLAAVCVQHRHDGLDLKTDRIIARFRELAWEVIDSFDF